MAKAAPPSLALRAYRLLACGLARVAPYHLSRRLAKGREDPARWREKLGVASLARPDGPLIWLNAVGLGEVMALRGLIEAMGRLDPSAHFLITSSARSSAEVLARNLPPRTIHHYMPLDAPLFLTRFLDHWRPDLSIWSDQEIWPLAVYETDRRGVPLAFLNARITTASLEKRKFIKSLYRDVLKRFELVLAQDPRSADNLAALGARSVAVSASLKRAAPVLSADLAELNRMQAMVKSRRVWVAASTHLEDESVAMAAQAQLFDQDPKWLLILAPRDPKRHLAMGLPYVQRSKGQTLAGEPVYLADTLGELGLWYRLSFAALMGGSFGPVEGHNPWEAAALGCTVIHGPRVGNFSADYADLQAGSAAVQVQDAGALIAALTDPDTPQRGLSGQKIMRDAASLDGLAARVLGLQR